ncbi:MAG TPA: hypothetical protein P5277_03620 [Candidatus Paceibacterota bacterium]|nr:hypothetical protein [Candidatus Paceibacterota bacterium]
MRIIRNNKGLIKIIGSIILIVIILIVLTGIYFYYFHVFKEFKVCISNSGVITQVPCINNSECVDIFLEEKGLNGQINSFPEFVKPYLNDIFNKSIYCSQTCRYKEIYGNLDEKIIDKCEENDQEVSYKIHGKEGLQWLVYKFKQKN